MLCRMLRGITGLRDGEVWPAVGELIELPEWEASNLEGVGVVEHVDIPERGVQQRSFETRERVSVSGVDLAGAVDTVALPDPAAAGSGGPASRRAGRR